MNLGSVESKLCSSLIDQKVKAGFHEVLGKKSDSYRQELLQAVFDSNKIFYPGLWLSVVETRIPWAEQAALLGIDIDPAIFYIIKQDLNQLPYATCLRVGTYNDGFLGYSKNTGETLANLPTETKHASLLEAISCDIDQILKKSFVLADGNSYGSSFATAYADALGIRSRIMCLDRFLGRMRITQVDRTSPIDTMIGVLVKGSGN